MRVKNNTFYQKLNILFLKLMLAACLMLALCAAHSIRSFHCVYVWRYIYRSLCCYCCGIICALIVFVFFLVFFLPASQSVQKVKHRLKVILYVKFKLLSACSLCPINCLGELIVICSL